MIFHRQGFTRHAKLLALMSWFSLSQIVIAANPEEDSPSAGEIPTREAILQSPRWQQLQQSFDHWLSVQKIYNANEIAEIKSRLEAPLESMSASELIDFVFDMEDRLDILLSEEATDARNYLSFFTEQARRKRIAPKSAVPQIFEMTAAQLRQELSQFQQERQRRRASHNNFRQIQGERVERVSQEQRERQVRKEQSVREARSQAMTLRQQQMQLQQKQSSPAVRSRYAPRPLVTGEDVARFEIMRGLF